MESARLCKILIGLVALGIKFCQAPDPADPAQPIDQDDQAQQRGGGNPGGTNPEELARGANTPPAGHTPGADGRLPGCSRQDGNCPRQNNLNGGTPEVEIKSGCNFYEREDLGVQPFSKVKKGEEMCEVKLKENADTFLYACDGKSEPEKCPEEVTVDGQVVTIASLFAVATTSSPKNITGNAKVSHVVTSKAHKSFTATCECTKADGKKETMKLTSSFKNVRIMGVLTLLVFLVMK